MDQEQQQQQQAAAQRSGKVCFAHQQGRCSHGDSCRFAHGGAQAGGELSVSGHPFNTVY